MATVWMERNPVAFKSHAGGARKVLKETDTEKVELFHLDPGCSTPDHFHPGISEFFYPHTLMTVYAQGMQQFIFPGCEIYIPQGIVHHVIAPSDSEGLYTIKALGDLRHPGRTQYRDKNPLFYRFSFAVYHVEDPCGQSLALALMNQVERWQHKPEQNTDAEQYIQKSGANAVKIVLLYAVDNFREALGAAFIGKADGYDLEKTQAMLAHGGIDPSIIGPEDIWLNYESWECVDGLTAIDTNDLPDVWRIFQEACRYAFPHASRVVVRSRHREIWEAVYCKPWEVLAIVNLHSPAFEWIDPSGKKFGNYSEAFSAYAILTLPL